jgi:hypothetical protein
VGIFSWSVLRWALRGTALELSCHLSPGDRRKAKTPQGDRQLRLDQVTVPDSGDYFREVQVRGSITAQKTAQVYVNWSESRIRGARHAADIEAISFLLTLKSTDCETGKENWQAIQRRAKSLLLLDENMKALRENDPSH